MDLGVKAPKSTSCRPMVYDRVVHVKHWLLADGESRYVSQDLDATSRACELSRKATVSTTERTYRTKVLR